MSSHKIDAQRRELARQVRRLRVEDFHDRLVEAGVTRAFVVSENGDLTLSHPALLAPVRAFLELSQDFDDHEGIFIGREEGIPTLFFAYVHDTRRGLAQGGLRFKPYASLADVLVDGLRLARGMTRKNALAGLWWGGGKGIVAITDALSTPDYLTEGSERRLELFEAYGRFIAGLGGVYYTAEDVGTKTSDLNAILGQNRFTTCVGATLGGSGNPSSHTARGVFLAMRAAWRFLTGDDDLNGVGVAVQGVGNVGRPLVELLDDAGARLWVSDIDRVALEALKRARPRLEIVEGDAIFDLPADVFAPCAIGAQVSSRTIPRFRVRLICGAANNVLEEPADAERLAQRGIAYVPDYLANRMGITNCADEWQGYLRHDVQLAAERVFPDTLRVLKHARSQMITTAEAADQLADVAAAELNPMIGHRGRRIIDHLIASRWHRPRNGGGPRALLPMAFDPGAHEPLLRTQWAREERFRGRGMTLAAAPISAATRPELSSFLSALLMDVRARAVELVGGERPRRVLGSDPGGLGLQLAVERALPFEREEIGRPRFVERCADLHRRHDAAIREQLHQLGVGFDPDAWLDPMSRGGDRASRRLFFALKDAGLVARERRLTYYDPTTQTVLVSPDVLRTRVEVRERFVVRFRVRGGGDIEAHTFFPELLPGAVALAVREGGPFAEFAGRAVDDPLHHGELPVLAFPDLATDAKFLVPAHDRDDEALATAHGVELRRIAIDERGRFLLPSEPPLVREEARRRVSELLGDRLTRIEGRFEVDALRARSSGTLVNLGYSPQVFVHFEDAAAQLRRAIESGSVKFSDPRWRRRSLELIADLEPWCVSRQYWWGHPLPEPRTANSDGVSSRGPRGEVLSVWFSLVASTLQALGWPTDAEPEPIDELYVDSERYVRWVLPSQLVSLVLTGRPAFRHVHVHGTLHVMERVLKERLGIDQAEPDEERFEVRYVRRPMRPSAGTAVEPETLIRRFGADALRLGYLLSLHPGSEEQATAAESHLRRARHTVRRLNAKVTGLFHMTRDEPEGGEPELADDWIVTRAAAAAEAARRAYGEYRLATAARLLTAAVDDLRRYAAIAAARPPGARGTIRSTVRALVERLASGFGPICPYLFEKLVAWTSARAATRSDAAAWIADLVAHVRRYRGKADTVSVGTSDPQVRERLHRAEDEIARLAGVRIEVLDEPGSGQTDTVGPCVVFRPEGTEPPVSDKAAVPTQPETTRPRFA